MPSETGQLHLLAFDSEFEFLRFDLQGGTGYVLLGDVAAEGARRVCEALKSDSGRAGPVEFLMEEAELIDGVSVALMVDALRLLNGRHDSMRLIGSPQMLAHTLYKVGMLGAGSRLVLVEPREEEGGAN